MYKIKGEKIVPLGKGIIVELLDTKESKSGLVLLNTWRVWKVGLVKAIGKNVEDISEGDIIYFRRFKPVEYKLKDFILTQEENILFKNKKENKKPERVYTIRSSREKPSA